MSNFTSHFLKNPVVTSMAELESLPVFSIIDVDGIIYEKRVTPEGKSSLFLELGSGQAEEYSVEGASLAENVADGSIKILRVG